MDLEITVTLEESVLDNPTQVFLVLVVFDRIDETYKIVAPAKDGTIDEIAPEENPESPSIPDGSTLGSNDAPLVSEIAFSFASSIIQFSSKLFGQCYISPRLLFQCLIEKPKQDLLKELLFVLN